MNDNSKLMNAKIFYVKKLATNLIDIDTVTITNSELKEGGGNGVFIDIEAGTKVLSFKNLNIQSTTV